jgi:hypothetical protein
MFLVRFVKWLWEGVKGLLSLILPLAQSAQTRRVGRVLWFILHLLLVAAILFGLWHLNSYLRLHNRIPNPRWLARFWLPVLFLLIYVLGWLFYWLWLLLVYEEPESVFPDIDAAWDAGVAALNRAGIDLRDVPVFLLLGQPEENEETVFQLPQGSLKVRKAPGETAPVHVWGSADAVYITCPNASALSRQAAWLHGKIGPDTGASAMSETDLLDEDGTMRPGQGGGITQQLHELALRPKREGRAANPVERRELRRLTRRDNPRGRQPDAAAIDEQVARLRYLCRLIGRDRFPFCPVNGILVLVPFAATDSSQDATDSGDAIARDLTAARAALGLHCPVLAVLCDMESAPGFTEFVAQFGGRERQRRMGQRCPLVPLVERTGKLESILRGLAFWLCTGFMRLWLYQKCQLEKPGGKTPEEVFAINSSLFLLLKEMRDRQESLARILEAGFTRHAPPEWLLFGGCYLAATGLDAQHNQAFMNGVLERLAESQECVYWTDEVRQREARLQGWINAGWGLLLVGVVAVVGLGVYAAKHLAAR